MISPWFGCMATSLTAAPCRYVRWMVPVRVSQMRTLPSSELVTIHFPSQWKATPVTLPAWPSKTSTGAGLLDRMSKSLTL